MRTPHSTSSNVRYEASLAKIAYPEHCYPANRYWGLAKNKGQIRNAWLRSSDRSDLINVVHKRASWTVCAQPLLGTFYSENVWTDLATPRNLLTRLDTLGPL